MGRHKEWRKEAKKIMRKRKRIQRAKERDKKLKLEEEKRAQSPSYNIWLQEQEKLELFRKEEESRLNEERNKRWLREEQLAQERWIKQQKRLQHLKAEKAKQDLIIKEEWEKEQQKLRDEAEARELEKQKKEREEAELLARIEKYITGESDRLPSSARTVTETHPGCAECPFFTKVAACRFRDECSRNHIRPSVSRTLIFPGFYSHFRIEHMNQSNEYDTDVGLEFDDREIYEDFLEFYNDVLCEMRTFGPVVQFKVCSNEEPHLRGNVYVQYSEERYAIKAFRALQGRFYGGRRISVEFCNISSWSKALCGLHWRCKCPKGSKCNFLHTFRNPDREFYNADRDIFMNSTSSKRKLDHSEEMDLSWSPESKSENNWNWSPESTSRNRRERRSVSKRTNSQHSTGREEKHECFPREKQNWSWSPSPEPVCKSKNNSSHFSAYRSKRSSESKYARSCKYQKSRKLENDNRSDDDRSNWKKSKENRTKRKPSTIRDEETS